MVLQTRQIFNRLIHYSSSNNLTNVDSLNKRLAKSDYRRLSPEKLLELIQFGCTATPVMVGTSRRFCPNSPDPLEKFSMRTPDSSQVKRLTLWSQPVSPRPRFEEDRMGTISNSLLPISNHSKRERKTHNFGNRKCIWTFKKTLELYN